MACKNVLLTAAALISLTFIASAELRSGSKAETSDTKVKATATAAKLSVDGKQTVTITLDIEKPWHIYANPVGLETAEPGRTQIAFSAKDKLTAEVKYPKGKVHDKGEYQHYIYEDRVVIEAQVTRTMGDTSPLQVTIKVSACKDGKTKDDAGACLLQGTLTVTVP